ncbi:histidine phosphatase [Endozoicomonas sp. OPT23]|uniref:SixA phosphatase family protein n=1 Tax=Endozoicomonas sp. OPT23 TaxID=2072845 RepID=UPI00129A0DEA|nr:histidine phosphatase family protein [Endozoicomonas sp. OPT23]MRI34204.1 histidine phosphatase [Endozoicomonas sp. OPT23]
MLVAIVRHGDAGFAAEDRLRTLTDYGRQQLELTAEKLKPYGFEQILTSSYVRARESGDILAQNLNLPISVLDGITPDDSATDAVFSFPEQGNLIIVSHMPLVSSLVSVLCEGTETGGPFFNTGSATILEMDLPGPGLARLKAFSG